MAKTAERPLSLSVKPSLPFFALLALRKYSSLPVQPVLLWHRTLVVVSSKRLSLRDVPHTWTIAASNTSQDTDPDTNTNLHIDEIMWSHYCVFLVHCQNPAVLQGMQVLGLLVACGSLAVPCSWLHGTPDKASQAFCAPAAGTSGTIAASSHVLHSRRKGKLYPHKHCMPTVTKC